MPQTIELVGGPHDGLKVDAWAGDVLRITSGTAVSTYEYHPETAKYHDITRSSNASLDQQLMARFDFQTERSFHLDLVENRDGFGIALVFTSKKTGKSFTMNSAKLEPVK